MAARHAAPGRHRRALARASLTAGLAGAALAAGAATASAEGFGEALERSTAAGFAPVKEASLNPLAGTGVDPLSNSVSTQVGDLQPVSTTTVTDPLSSGGTMKDLPVAGQAMHMLPG